MILRILLSKFCHRFNDRLDLLSGLTEGIFDMRNLFIINCPDCKTVFFHRMQRIRQHFLADPIEISFQLVKTPGLAHQIAQNQRLLLAANQGDGYSCRTIRHFLFFTLSKEKIVFTVQHSS